MDALPLMLASAHLIGWALVHFVWQGVLLGLVYGAVRAVLPRGEARYRFGMAMLIALAVCPLLTVWRLLEAPAPVLLTATETATRAATIDSAAKVGGLADGTWTGNTWAWDSGSQSWSQRHDRRSACRKIRRPALRLRQLSALHHHVRRRGARHRSSLF
jgi:hypothetical protein